VVCLSVAVVGVSYGAVAVTSGFPLWVPVTTAVVVLAGSSEFLFVGIIAAGGSPVAAVLAGLLVNARHIMVLPNALPAIMTGVMLATARAAGETAPVLFTAAFNQYWLRTLMEPAGSLAVLIYNFSTLPYTYQVQMAWTASLVLLALVTLTNVTAQLVFSRGRR
jgi:hypothetical protein